MVASTKKETSLFFNQRFDKKRLKALISWVFKKSGEAEALRVLDLLKETGFSNATKAGISIGIHDLTTPIQKSWLISESQQSMNTTDREFVGAKITATERRQRIVDTWHRASESLSKQVVEYFGIYDTFNPVYIMALSGARGNFSQVRQLIGMRGLMADQQGKIVSFPIRSNLREGLTLTEYFISCSGARKGLVDTALRTADTGYLTRRLVDVSHHVVVKRIRCNTSRGIVFTSLQSYNKTLLPLKERLVGRVLAEDIYEPLPLSTKKEISRDSRKFAFAHTEHSRPPFTNQRFARERERKRGEVLSGNFLTPTLEKVDEYTKRDLVKNGHGFQGLEVGKKLENTIIPEMIADPIQKVIAKKDQEISPKLSLEISRVRNEVFIRSPLTCGFTHSVCQLCYGWSISQGGLVSLGDAVGVIAAQSIGEPGTQLTMRTFHTGGVFSGDLLQEIRAPHAGTITFSSAFRGLLIRTAHGRIAFLSKIKGTLFLYYDHNHPTPHEKKGGSIQRQKKGFSSSERDPLFERKARSIKQKPSFTEIPVEPFTMLFVRQGERVETNQLLAEFSIQSKEGNQPIKTEQTIFAEISGRIVEDRTGSSYRKEVKESVLLVEPSRNSQLLCKSSFPMHKDNESRISKSSLQPRAVLQRSVRPYRARVLPGANLLRLALSLQRKRKEHSPCHRRYASTLTCVPCRAPSCRAVPRRGKKGQEGARHGTASTCVRARNATLRVESKVTQRNARVTFPSILLYPSKALICLIKGRTKKTERKGQSKKKKTVLLTRPERMFLNKLIGQKRKRFDKALSVLIKQNIAQPFYGLRVKKPNETRLSIHKKCWAERFARTKSKDGIYGRAEHCITNLIRKTSCIESSEGRVNRKYNAQILSSLKRENQENDIFKYIEPVKSGRLGLLKIVSTRIGATLDYHCPIKPLDYSLIKKKGKEASYLSERKNGRTSFEPSCVRLFSNKHSFFFSKYNKNMSLNKPVKYLHHEYLKENRFFLQTIAEYGDVVEENYKTKTL